MKQVTVPTKAKFLKCDTFIIARPTNHYYIQGEDYNVLCEDSQYFIDSFNLVSKRTIHFNDITCDLSFLIADINLDDFKKLWECYTLKTEGFLDVLVFTASRYVRLFNVETSDKENLASLRSAKKLKSTNQLNLGI